MCAFSDFFKSGTSDNLDDIFGASFLDHGDDDWITSQLHMPSAPIDDFRSSVQPDIDSDESTSSDEESPVVIRQKPQGNAAKYILSGLFYISLIISYFINLSNILSIFPYFIDFPIFY